MTERDVIVYAAVGVIVALYYISRNIDRLLAEARRIRQALERSSPP